MTSILLPPLEAEEVEKFKAACLAIGETLNAAITIEEVVSLRIGWQNNRGDVASVITTLAERKAKKKTLRGKDIKFSETSEDYVDSKKL